MQQLELVIIVIILIALSAIFSGLNISFMSLHLRDLRHKAKLGDRQAQKVLPLRSDGHLTLAAILYANVGAVTSTGLVIGEHTGGVIAGFTSTILLVIFGEILPQAYFSRSALRLCAFFAPLLRFSIIVTYILSKPTALLLDRLMPHQERPLRSRGELGLLISEYKGRSPEVDDDEVEIIRSTLQLSRKSVEDIMVPIERVFWLRNQVLIDKQAIDMVKERGYSRIPVFDENLQRSYGALLMKDMFDVDFADEPRIVTDFVLHSTRVIGPRMALDTLFRQFQSARTHLMVVKRESAIIGIVTIEDLLEEVIGHEIIDETDYAHRRV